AVLGLGLRTRPRPYTAARIDRYEAYADATGAAFRSALWTADGRMLSYVCGVVEGDAAHVLYQLNDHHWYGLSPSLVHRAHLIERFTAAGQKNLIFVHGCIGTLVHACEAFPAEEIWLARRSLAGRAKGAVLAKLWPKIPDQVRTTLMQFALE